MPKRTSRVEDQVILNCISICIEAHFGDIKFTCESLSVKLLYIREQIIEFQPFSIYSAMHHCIENERIIRARRETKCQFHSFIKPLKGILPAFLTGQQVQAGYSTCLYFAVQSCLRLTL